MRCKIPESKFQEKCSISECKNVIEGKLSSMVNVQYPNRAKLEYNSYTQYNFHMVTLYCADLVFPISEIYQRTPAVTTQHISPEITDTSVTLTVVMATGKTECRNKVT